MYVVFVDWCGYLLWYCVDCVGVGVDLFCVDVVFGRLCCSGVFDGVVGWYDVVLGYSNVCDVVGGFLEFVWWCIGSFC